MRRDQHEEGFILMIVMMVLLIVAVAAFAFMRVQSGEGISVPETSWAEPHIR